MSTKGQGLLRHLRYLGEGEWTVSWRYNNPTLKPCFSENLEFTEILVHFNWKQAIFSSMCRGHLEGRSKGVEKKGLKNERNTSNLIFLYYHLKCLLLLDTVIRISSSVLKHNCTRKERASTGEQINGYS